MWQFDIVAPPSLSLNGQCTANPAARDPFDDRAALIAFTNFGSVLLTFREQRTTIQFAASHKPGTLDDPSRVTFASRS